MLLCTTLETFVVLFKFAFCVYFFGQMMKHVTQHAYFSISEKRDNDDDVFKQDEPEPPQKREWWVLYILILIKMMI